MEQPVVSSFSSIIKTVIHITAAEKIWIDRLSATDNPVFYQPDTVHVQDELEHFKHISSELSRRIKLFSETDLMNSVAYTDLKIIATPVSVGK